MKLWIYRHCFLWRFCVELWAWRPIHMTETWTLAVQIAYQLARLTPEQYAAMEGDMQAEEDTGLL